MSFTRTLARLALALTTVASLGVAFAPSAAATGCDNQVGPVRYGDDVKPVDICVGDSSGTIQTEVVVIPNSNGATGGQYVCAEFVCQGTAFDVSANPTDNFAQALLCSGSVCADVEAGTREEAIPGGTRYWAGGRVCVVDNLGYHCVVNESRSVDVLK